MTEQQLQIIKQLSERYKLLAENLDKTLLFLGVGYGLTEDQIEQYLSLGEGKLLEKHLIMLCLVLDIEKSDVDADIEKGEDGKLAINEYPKERLRDVLKEHYTLAKKEKSEYERLSQYILNSVDLSAAQIEQLRLAAKTGMPERDIMVLARAGREPMEIKRCVEFYEMIHLERRRNKKNSFK